MLIFNSHTPPAVRSVRLLGSWDNFTTEYPMERDPRMGTGHWRGCHTFKNITCDGEARATGPSRQGGLKMGGKYWYYVCSLFDMLVVSARRQCGGCLD
jgi:hypothetical protein